MSHTQCLGFLLDYNEFVLYASLRFGGITFLFLKHAFGTGLISSGKTYKYSHPHICIYIYNKY